MNEENKYSILIIDDDPNNIAAFTDILKDDYNLFAVTLSKNALEVAEAEIPDLILLDILMPDLDGYDVLAALKNSEVTRNIPVVFVTGLDGYDAEEKGLELGAADYISKPFHPAIIKLRLKNQIKLSERDLMERHYWIIENSPSIIVSINPDGGIDDINPAASESTGYSRNDFFNKGLGAIFSEENIADIKNKHIPAVMSGEKIQFETGIYLKDGKFGVFIVSIFKTGKASITFVLRDVTKMRRLEIENRKLYIDGLTDIYNRRYFNEAIERKMMTLSRAGSTMTLMMIDIDFFKKYNDTYGHSLGDDCLRIIAGTLSRNLPRADDFIARYGGEEFVIVLPSTDEDGAHLVAERMLSSIRGCVIPHDTSEAANYVTVSIGVATGMVKHTHIAGDFVDRADKMLYKSKHNGRNQYNLCVV